MPGIKFGIEGVSFDDLYDPKGLKAIDALFCKFLHQNYPDLFSVYINKIAEDQSAFILQLAPALQGFLAKLFTLNDQHQIDAAKRHSLMYKFKRSFIDRKAAKITPTKSLKQLQSDLNISHDADDFVIFEKLQQAIANNLEADALEYCAHQLNTNRKEFSYLFFTPQKLDFANLVATKTINQTKSAPEGLQIERDGFDHTDPGITNLEMMANATYCLYCHPRNKDSCSKGLKDKADQYQHNALRAELKGCPLEEKISEMNLLASKGLIIAALATAIINNPMLAATGHRICNDCMKACIYQKQQPVDIPKIESSILEQVLNFDYGFEIYSLLTRWNPLNLSTPMINTHNPSKTVMVAGLGPAGFTLSHYLLNSGVGVIAIDGLKIEPLDGALSGVNIDGKRVKFTPIKDIKQLYEPLSKRIPYGFGGVAEYGITARWNKNYLKVIRLLLERRSNFRMYGSTRLGSDITIDQVKKLGISHIALCFGAGSPKLLQIPNIMAKGVRFASDFLMALQLSGAHRKDSTNNLQIRMPIAVIGGGLTAIDTATESLEYYASQVIKVYQRFNQIGDGIFTSMDEQQKLICQEYIDHGKMIMANPTRKNQILNDLGGATICYRGALEQSTAYRLNHEEVAHAFAEGINFKEHIIPLAIEIDQNQSASAITHKNGSIPARSIFIATGTKPNTVLAREVAGIELDGDYFKKDLNHSFINPKKQQTSVIMQSETGLSLSFFGDLHPEYAGNVVKAMASAKDGFTSVLNNIKLSDNNFNDICKNLDNLLDATVVEINHLAPRIVEVIVRAPIAAANFKPGQFFRLQNFEYEDPTLKMEAIALTGAFACNEQGLLSLIILEMGGSSDFCKHLKIGERLSLMGPTGTPTFIPQNKKVMLIGGGLGNAVLFSIGQACRQNGCEVLYFAGYKNLNDMFKRDEITKSASQVVWCCDQALPSLSRTDDLAVKGNMLDAIERYDQSNQAKIPLSQIDNIIVIGSDKMMAAVSYYIHHHKKHKFSALKSAIASINSPMQCMMKEICGQCIQRHIDPKTKQPYYIYSCFNQDQPIDRVDFSHLNARLAQNEVLEKICANWIKHNNQIPL